MLAQGAPWAATQPRLQRVTTREWPRQRAAVKGGKVQPPFPHRFHIGSGAAEARSPVASGGKCGGECSFLSLRTGYAPRARD